jgi:tetratricopeptide (TPR) repeat protein
MAKHKKNTPPIVHRGFGLKAQNLDAELRRVAAYATKEDWLAACSVLQSLSQQYPHEKRVWEYLTDTSFELGDMKLYQKACEGLFAVAPTGENAYMLGGAYLNNQHPLMALQTFRQALELDPNNQSAEQAKETVEQLKPILNKVLANLGMTEANGLEIAILHERGQAYLEQGDAAAAREAEEAVLKQHPEFVSARNNLSLVSWMEGDVSGAILMAQAVLESHPDNIHALSNLIRFLVISNNFDTAKSYGERLKASHADAWDGWTKKVEGLSYLADDAGIVEVWKEAQAAKVEESPAGAMFYHLSAVALARTGDTKRAIARWQEALERHPNYRIAQKNLEDIRNPIGQRHGAWPFEWEQWLMLQTNKELKQALDELLRSLKLGKSRKLIPGLRDFLEHHPDVITRLPNILERGGPQGQEFVLNIAEQVKTPQLLNLLKDFALGQNGTDQMRNRTANMLAQAQIIPKDKVRLWMEGEWREVMLLAYEFHDDLLYKHSKQVGRLLGQAIQLLHYHQKEEAIEAEMLLRKALEMEPDSPDLMNNLALATLLQDKEAESNALIQQIVAQHPDYVFAKASLAKLHLIDGEVEAAEELLKPFLSRDRFHFSEFGAFCDAYIELLLAKKQKDGARTWLNMWEQVYDKMDADDPRLDRWYQRLNPVSRISSLNTKMKRR